MAASVQYLFVESVAERAAHLERRVESLRPQLPAGSRAYVHVGKFDATLESLLDTAVAEGKQLAPAFVMVDPFGVSETPMAVLARILKNPRSELYVSFMYEAINRFRAAPEFEQHLDSLFGNTDWRDGIDMPESDDRRHFFYDLYTRQLKAVGAKHVVRFELFDGNRHVYTIFFATQHHLGCNRMKEAIWKAAPDGGYQFRASRHGQTTLFDLLTADLELFREEIRSTFAGSTVSIDALERWASGDGTVFHSGHLKRTLKIMEQAGEIMVTMTHAKPRRRGTFAIGSVVAFRDTAQSNAS
jgi:three-Cys-motif partner protein